LLRNRGGEDTAVSGDISDQLLLLALVDEVKLITKLLLTDVPWTRRPFFNGYLNFIPLVCMYVWEERTALRKKMAELVSNFGNHIVLCGKLNL
jgi:hypothetical protein